MKRLEVKRKSKMKEAREKLGWTQEYLSQVTGYTREYLNKLENDGNKNPTIKAAKLISYALGIKIDEV